MTKFLKKVFVCGALLSSVSAYCANAEFDLAWEEKLADDKLTLAESFLVVGDNRTTHANTTIGALDTGLTTTTKTESDNSITRVLQATAFPIATITENSANGTATLQYLFENVSDKPNVVLVGGDTYHFGTNEDIENYSWYIYPNDIATASESIDAGTANYSFFSSDGTTWKSANAELPVTVIPLVSSGDGYTLSDNTLFFTGPVATKAASESNWKLLNGNDLPRVTLTVSEGCTLTVGDQVSYVADHSVATLNAANAPEGTTLSYHQNTDPAFIKFTEFSEVTGKSKLKLLNTTTTNYEQMPTGEITNINNPTLETKAIIEPGSKFGASENPVEILDGETDVGGFFEIKDNKVVGNQDDGQQVFATVNGKINVFSGIMPEALPPQDKSAAIDLFNESSVSDVFQGISGTFNVDVPYTYNVVGGTAYDDIDTLVPSVSAEDKVSLNIASKAKIGGLFAIGPTITYTMNGKPTENLSALVDETIAYAHDISGDTTKTVFLDVSSVKNFDNTFKSDEYFYSGPAGTKAVNVIPLDGDAYVIPYDNKHTDTMPPERFDLKASTDKDPDAIQKYLEPDMTSVKIKNSNGEPFQDTDQQNITQTVSTELLGLGTDKTKTFFMNNANNGTNDSAGPNLTITGCDLKVKSKTGDEINRNILTLNNSKAILSGTNTVQNINMDSNSTLRIRGTFNWGTPAA